MTYKHSVITDDYTDVMIHPEPISGELKELWKEFLSRSVAEDGWSALKECVACGGEDLGEYFSIWGFRYDRCRACASVFLNPQPPKDVYEKAFFDSPISRFVNSDTFQDNLRTRFKKAILPQLTEIIASARKDGLRVLEVFGRDRNIIDYLNKQQKIGEYLRFESSLEDISGGSRTVDRLEEIGEGSCDLILLLMAAERMRAPQRMFPLLAEKLAPGGLLVVLARLGSGIDVQVLRENNPSTYPLEHTYLLSVEGYEHLMDKAGLEVIELSTPGLLDAEYLKDFYKNNPDKDDIFQYFFKHRSSLEIERFQGFVQEMRLSSALKLICRRKNES